MACKSKKWICQRCNKKFIASAKSKIGIRRFCSRQCANKQRKGTFGFLNKHHSNLTRRKMSEKAKIIHQKKNFGFQIRNEINLGRKHSKETKRKMSDAHKGEKNINWKGGSSFEPYSLEWTEKLREKIRKRDNYTCQICGRIQKKGFLDVHHIDYDKNNCNLNNLVTLCHDCHSDTNYNRKYWKQYFYYKLIKGTIIYQQSEILDGAQVGNNCIIGHNCLIFSGAKIGNNVKLQGNTDVYNEVTLGDWTFIGPSAVFTNDKNPRAKYPKLKYPQYGKWLPTKIKMGATIGANATIVCGNTVGKWAMIGAGAVVTESIPDYAIVAGVPAKIIGWICECGTKLRFVSRICANKGTNVCKYAVCKICKRKYKKIRDKVKEII